MSLLTRARAQIRETLRVLGQDMTLRRVVGADSGGYDPATSTVGTTSNSDVTVRAHLVSNRKGIFQQPNVERGSRVALISSLDASLSPLSQVPENGDLLIGSGDDVTLGEVREIQYEGGAVLYVAEVRE